MRVTLRDFILAGALFLALTLLPAYLVGCLLWIWALPHFGAPFVLALLIGVCWAAARAVWR